MFFDYVDFQLNVLTILASKGRMAGRELCKEVSRVMNKNFSYGTFYSRMRGMAEQGLVTAEDEDNEDRKRRYYEIADKGKSKRIELLSDAQKKGREEGLDGIPEPAKVRSR